MTPKAIREYHKERLKVVTRSTLCRDLVPLRECLRWAFDEGLIDEPVTVLLPKKRAKGSRAHDTRLVELTDIQAEALIRALPERTRKGHPMRDLFTVAWDTGLRHGGVFRLEAGRHFKPGVRELYLTADIDKARYERPIPLTERAYQALERNAPDIGPIFTEWGYYKGLRSAAKTVDLIPPDDAKKLHLRAIRHAAITDGARKAGHLTGSSYMAGHTNQRTTDRYIHPQSDDAKEVLYKRFPSNDTRCVESDRDSKEGAC